MSIDSKDQDNSEFEDTEEIFASLANSQWLAILQGLSKKEMTLSSIAREFEVSVQETHRNLNKLVSTNIVEKDLNVTFH
jgi:predicted transcriptional regulator